MESVGYGLDDWRSRGPTALLLGPLDGGSKLHKLPELGDFQVAECGAPGEIEFKYDQMYIQWRSGEIQSPTQWNLVGRSMTTSSLLLSPSSILPSPSTHGALIPARKEN